VKFGFKEILLNLCTLSVILLFAGCSSMYFLDSPVSDPIMFADDNQNSDLDRAEDGGLAGSAGECPT